MGLFKEASSRQNPTLQKRQHTQNGCSSCLLPRAQTAHPHNKVLSTHSQTPNNTTTDSTQGLMGAKPPPSWGYTFLCPLGTQHKVPEAWQQISQSSGSLWGLIQNQNNADTPPFSGTPRTTQEALGPGSSMINVPVDHSYNISELGYESVVGRASVRAQHRINPPAAPPPSWTQNRP